MNDWEYYEEGKTPFPEGTEIDYEPLVVYLPCGDSYELNKKQPIGFDLTI